VRGVVLDAPGDVHAEDGDDPKILMPTDAMVHFAARCICGSDLRAYREA
jgi:threonine dehydrogenase-like Zn-dependent dehydrogenase